MENRINITRQEKQVLNSFIKEQTQRLKGYDSSYQINQKPRSKRGDQSIDLNFRYNERGDTLAHIAAKAGNRQVLDIILGDGTDADRKLALVTKNYKNQTPATVARREIEFDGHMQGHVQPVADFLATKQTEIYSQGIKDDSGAERQELRAKLNRADKRNLNKSIRAAARERKAYAPPGPPSPRSIAQQREEGRGEVPAVARRSSEVAVPFNSKNHKVKIASKPSEFRRRMGKTSANLSKTFTRADGAKVAHLAAENGDLRALNIIAGQGKKGLKALVEVRNNFGETPLDVAERTAREFPDDSKDSQAIIKTLKAKKRQLEALRKSSKMRRRGITTEESVVENNTSITTDIPIGSSLRGKLDPPGNTEFTARKEYTVQRSQPIRSRSAILPKKKEALNVKFTQSDRRLLGDFLKETAMNREAFHEKNEQIEKPVRLSGDLLHAYTPVGDTIFHLAAAEGRKDVIDVATRLGEAGERALLDSRNHRHQSPRDLLKESRFKSVDARTQADVRRARGTFNTVESRRNERFGKLAMAQQKGQQKSQAR